ncbi:prepilin peptidase [Desulforamulus aeronauticus]|uniref:Leader peptidase (Prepilin peptidase) / N-methyltransferase n=1 Tax=Desulforamulus aeronauticus DSM 10349 TaxID=1121421 RepID=A0A1M6PHX7_9FIRM|nr:A24 family peptidase [Desulforamulus aeronauticus]SHK07539.1 leader peptidase (prepilin peptidase) / N-methyltransferase [Desulforamulus aeronauticus DSM 10349]
MYIVLFFLGLILGSFLNVCIYRTPRGESIVSPPSACPKCKNRLLKRDLIPVISYLWLWGKCRFCHDSINLRYPIIELLTGLLFATTAYKLDYSIVTIQALLLISALIVISFIDLDHYIIPDKMLIFLLITWIAFLPFTTVDYLNSFAGLAAAGGLFLMITFVSKGGLGMGDSKLAAVLGLYLGWPNALLAMFLACFLAGIVGIFLILLKIKSPKDIIPFGPFMALAAFITLLWGDQILHWYTSLL